MNRLVLTDEHQLFHSLSGVMVTMNTSRFIYAFLAVFILVEVTNYIIHGLLLNSYYQQSALQEVFRSEEVMNSKMWMMWVTDLVWSFFFVLIFIKGYEFKSIVEGIKFGIYIGVFYSFVIAYQSYVIHPLPYGLTFQWFIYGLIQAVLAGLLAAIIYKPEEEPFELPPRNTVQQE